MYDVDQIEDVQYTNTSDEQTIQVDCRKAGGSIRFIFPFEISSNGSVNVQYDQATIEDDDVEAVVRSQHEVPPDIRFRIVEISQKIEH